MGGQRKGETRMYSSFFGLNRLLQMGSLLSMVQFLLRRPAMVQLPLGNPGFH
jgi:hypothetical protein